MKFGEFPLDEAVGGILAHSQRLPDDSVIRKGTVLTDELADVMHAASMESVIVALPEPDDVAEDEAATGIAHQFGLQNMRVDKAKTGRVNFFATSNGVFRVDAGKVNALNALDPGITFATLPDFAEVNEGRMVATVKIIPYAIAGEAIDALDGLNLEGAISVVAYLPKKIGLVFTLLPGTRPKLLDKTRAVLERRLALSGSEIVFEQRVFHVADDVSAAFVEAEKAADMVIAFGASAISDRADIIPVAIEQAGGEIIRFGMPVDPGNLMLLAELNGKPVIGAPGCARSPAENGFDWVLQRLLADIPVTSEQIAGLGVGGLLMETGARPHPREKREAGPGNVAAIVLAAGQSRRMGEANKMTVEINGKPMVRHVAEAVKASKCCSAFVVTGHQAEDVRSALDGLAPSFAHNPDYMEGLASSLKTGIEALGENVTHAIVLLGDMPFVTSEMINRMIGVSSQNPGKIVLSTYRGKRGNPVLWPKRFFEELRSIEGDVGARHIIAANPGDVVELELGEAVSIDLDTPDAVERYNGGKKR